MTNQASSQIDQHQTPGVRRTIAFALGVLGMDAVQRSTLRALLPKGETKLRGPVTRERWHLGAKVSIGKNKTSVKFGQTLQDFEARGWVERTPDLVVVYDRRALFACALDGQPAVTPNHLNIKHGLQAARDDLRRTRVNATVQEIERRHDEIEALLYLLHTSAATHNFQPA
ncbi:hypothetical protein [Streptomyces phaeoluteigriseus]|uniref:hypothetical protein n=1 Tax=Streptomyces phaeoluteigriseus TaxID=114686 RepID=UPI0036CA8B4B